VFILLLAFLFFNQSDQSVLSDPDIRGFAIRGAPVFPVTCFYICDPVLRVLAVFADAKNTSSTSHTYSSCAFAKNVSSMSSTYDLLLHSQPYASRFQGFSWADKNFEKRVALARVMWVRLRVMC